MTEALKSNSITNIDANPPVRPSAGEYGFGTVVMASDYVSPGATATSPSTYRLLRVPTNARNLKLELESHGTITTLTGDLTIYYSDATIDETGSSQGNTGVVNSLSTTNSLFASAITSMATEDTPVDATNLNGKYPVAARSKALWDAAGLTTDPGGFFDIVFATTATNSLTAGATLGLRASYVIGWR